MNEDSVLNRDTTVIIDDSSDNGIISAAVSGVIDPEATFSVAFDEVLNVMVIGVENFGEETKEIVVDADAFWILTAALTRTDITQEENA